MRSNNLIKPQLLDFHDLRLRLSSKLAPFSPPDVFFLDNLEVVLSKIDISKIIISGLEQPLLSPNYCFEETKIWESDIQFKNPKVNDFSSILRQVLLFPEIESIFVPLNPARINGKAYPKKGETEDKIFPQQRLFSEERCKHDLQEGTCSTCLHDELQKKKKSPPPFDIFDLILPILQPPLKLDAIYEFLPNKELYTFQPGGVKFLATHDSALLGDEMGLGKTIQAIIAISLLFHSGKATNAIVICPRSVFSTWENEFYQWAPALRVSSVRGAKLVREFRWASPSHIYLTTYETLREDIETLPKKDFDICILDEIQKIKNPGAQVAKTVRQINAKFRWGLSGTPLENKIEDLISIFAYLKPGILRYEDAPWPKIIMEKIKPYFLRRRKADVLKDLPAKVTNIDWLTLAPAQQEAYDKTEQEGIVALNEQGDSVTVQHIFGLITKLKQICNFDIVSGESCKLEYLRDKLEAIQEQGDKALIFSQFPEKTLTILEEKLQEYKPFRYHGGLSDKQRDYIVDKFQNEEENRILLMSVKAGGLGITLTRANYVYHFDQWWNPATSMQAEDRTHRIGQKKTVFATAIMTKRTVEERIHVVLERKRSLFKEVIDDLSDTNLTNVLTKEELFSLFNLNVGKKTEKEEQAKTIVIA